MEKQIAAEFGDAEYEAIHNDDDLGKEQHQHTISDIVSTSSLSVQTSCRPVNVASLSNKSQLKHIGVKLKCAGCHDPQSS